VDGHVYCKTGDPVDSSLLGILKRHDVIDVLVFVYAQY
jgi:hypothetical protein